MNELPLFTPFRGEHYADPGSLSRRLAPPYDVIGPVERERLVALDEANIVRADLPVAPQGDDPYRAAKDGAGVAAAPASTLQGDTAK